MSPKEPWEGAINVAMIVGSQIGSYTIERLLAEGGMGVVYVGVHRHLGRRDAIKQLRSELSGRRDLVGRFFTEAKAVANINHPGIVPIYEFGWHIDGSAYFAMKLLEGDTLATRLCAGPMPPAAACTVGQQIASVLAAAHAVGIVHRDLKPDNIVLERDDAVALGERAIVLDFGIAKLTGDWLMLHKMRTDSAIGTPPYMSPEQYRRAGEVDHRTDVYAVGCILFEMLTGRTPFVGDNHEVITSLLFDAPPTVRSLRGDVSPGLEALVMRCLAKQPDQRYQTMTELIAALRSCSANVHLGLAVLHGLVELIAAQKSCLANGALPPEIGASPASPPMGDLPIAVQAPAGERGPDASVEGEQGVREAVQAPAGERGPDAPVEGEQGVREAVQAPAGERGPDAPVEGEQGVREAGSRGDVVTPQPRARKRWLFSAVVASVIAVGAVVFALSAGAGRSSSDDAGPPDAALGAPSDAAGPPDAALDVVPADPPAATTATRDAAQAPVMQDADSGTFAQLAKAKQALDEERWQGALQIVESILRRDPTNAGAQTIRMRAKSELANKENYRKMIRQIERGQLHNAIISYHQIRRKSPYSDLARPEIIKAIREGAQLLFGKHQCAELEDLASVAGGKLSEASLANLRCQESLDGNMIRSGVAKVMPGVSLCHEKSPAQGQVKVSVKVGPDGRVTSVTVKSAPDAILAACVMSEVQKARFAETLNGGSFSYPFNF